MSSCIFLPIILSSSSPPSSPSSCPVFEHYFLSMQVDVLSVSLFLFISKSLLFRLTTAISFCCMSSRIRLNHRVLCLSTSRYPLNSSSDAQITLRCWNSDWETCLFVPSKSEEGRGERSDSTRADETCGHWLCMEERHNKLECFPYDSNRRLTMAWDEGRWLMAECVIWWPLEQ